MQIAFIVNSQNNKSRRLIEQLPPRLPGESSREILRTTHHRHAISLADEAASRGCELIVAVGGDGTINQCVNGILYAVTANGAAANQTPPLFSALPAGSGNDLARTISFPASGQELARSLETMRIRSVDVGCVSYADRDPCYFMNIAETGLGTTVIERAARWQRWIGDRLAYQAAIMRTVAFCPEFAAQVDGDEFSFQGRFSTIAIANAKYFGSGLGIAPAAEVDDGLLDVVLMRAFSPWDFLRYLGKLKRCQPIDDPRIQTYQTAKLSVTGKAKTSLDGELGQRLPASIEVRPGAIRVIEFQR